MELLHYTYHQERKRKAGKAAMILIVGMVILSIWGMMETLLSDEQNNTQIVLKEFLVTFAGVFLTEAMIVLFMEAREYDSIAYDIIRRFSSLSLLDGAGRVMSHLVREDIMKDWRLVKSKELRARTAILIFGTLQTCFTILWFGDNSAMIKNVGGTLANIALMLDGCSVATSVLAGFGAISLYRERGRLRKILYPVSIMLVIINAAEYIVLQLIAQKAEEPISALTLILLIVISAVSVAFLLLVRYVIRIDKKGQAAV